jgi:DNA polymerase-3 subunit alpha
MGGKNFGDKHEWDIVPAENWKSAVRLVEWYKDVFGDRYYIECQRFPGLGRTCALNKAYERLSDDTGVGLVATSDCHYVFARDNEMQKILHASHRASSVSQVEASWEYDVTLDIPQSDEQIVDDLVNTGLSSLAAYTALENTAYIAERCNVSLPKVDPIIYPITEADWVESWV